LGTLAARLGLVVFFAAAACGSPAVIRNALSSSPATADQS
jgi:hypothetical protein